MPADRSILFPGKSGVAEFRVGADLRAARERLGWDLASVAAGLRIRQSYLAALEAGRLRDLPATAYALGFLRAYAAALGLNADDMARRYRAEAAELNRRTELTFPAPVPERGMPAGALALLGVVLAVGVYVGWYRITGDQAVTAQAVPDVPDRLAPLARLGSVPTASPQVASVLPGPGPGAAGGDAAAGGPPATRPGAAASLATDGNVPARSGAGGQEEGGAMPAMPGPPLPQVPPSQAAAAIPNFQIPVPVPLPVQPPAAPEAAAAASLMPRPEDGRITLRAKAQSWVQVRERQGPVLLNRLLQAGETWQVPAGRAQLLLTTGNAVGTEVLVDGVLAPPIPGVGVRRDLPLDPDAIRAGRYGVATAQAVPPRGSPESAPGGGPAAAGAQAGSTPRTSPQ